jgi:uncharacterized protein
MRRLFADSLYWIALSDQRDQWHAAALQTSLTLPASEIVTTQEMLGEFLTAFRHAPRLPAIAGRRGLQIITDRQVRVRPQSDRSFQAGFALYKSRSDKEYILADCISKEMMHHEGVSEILIHDVHFGQEGFTVLL